MIEIRRILCPIDFSDFSDRAVRHAVAMASSYDAEVHVLHVLPILQKSWVAPLAGHAETGSRVGPESFSGAVGRLLEPAREAGVTTEVHVREGDVTTELLAYANACDVDLVVMGTHGRNGFQRLVLGSVTEKVLRRSTCPVLTVCHAPQPRVASGPPFHRIVCAVDFSPSSLHALHYALELAQDPDAALHVVYVEEPYYHRLAPDRLTANADRYDRYVEQTAGERLDRLVTACARGFYPPRTAVRNGRVWEEILAQADEIQADLVVMGVHGHWALDVAVFGSNANTVVRRAHCPVLTIAETVSPAGRRVRNRETVSA